MGRSGDAFGEGEGPSMSQPTGEHSETTISNS
jgi:hypothetical protein